MHLLSRFTLFFISSLYLLVPAFSQDVNDEPSSSIKEKFVGKMEFGGYIQTQWNRISKPDSIALNTPGYGFFDRSINNRFTIRRGRFVIGYNAEVLKARMQIDLNERGLFLEDAYIQLDDPWLKVFSLTTGLFVNPFGYDVVKPSRDRIFMERSRVVNTLFPSIRDLGAKIAIKAPEESKLEGLKLQAAVVNGTLGRQDFDSYKDFVGQIRYDKTWNNFSLGIGASGYYGGIRHIYDIGSDDAFEQYKYILKPGVTPQGFNGFYIDTAASIATGRYGGRVNKYYYGGDIQLGIKSKAGKTHLLAEYIGGQQISREQLLNVNAFYYYTSQTPFGFGVGVFWPFFAPPPSPFIPQSPRVMDIPSHTFVRNFNGGYVGLIQEIGNTGLSVGFRYEWYDPNTQVKGKEVFLALPSQLEDGETFKLVYTSAADVRYQIFSPNIAYRFANDRLRISAQYDFVRNEIADIRGISFNSSLIRDNIYPQPDYREDINDDMLTLRLQFNF